jgi:hypothetical protein
VIWTTTVVHVIECWQGSCAQGTELELRTLGGVVGDIEQRVAGLAAPKVGGKMLLFVREAPGGTYSPVGLAQGVMRIETLGQREVAVRDLHGLRLVGAAGVVDRGESQNMMVPLDELRAAFR